jgi:hypothetical protein
MNLVLQMLIPINKELLVKEVDTRKVWEIKKLNSRKKYKKIYQK